jgi:plasmid maintenance system antidote protein VapI
MNQADLAERTGLPRRAIAEIIKGKAAITPETAFQLEGILDISAGFWNAREALYRDSLSRHKNHWRLQG